MALSYKARRRWALFILLVGMPLYVVVVVTILNILSVQQAPFVVELLVYVVLGVLWVLPFKWVFRGVGQPDPGKDA